MEKLLGGVIEFHRYRAPRLRPEFRRLVAEGQSPQALLITCGDSRVMPELFTTADPGDLFKLRNIGNLVPPCDAGGNYTDRSVSSAVEFALDVLNTPHIIVCGHSDCGAMKAVLRYEDLPENSAIRDWLEPAADSRNQDDHIALEVDPAEPPHDQLGRRNVLRQLNNLRTYPVVKAALESGRVLLHAWFFDVARAELQAYHPARMRFVTVDDKTAEELCYLSQVFAPPAGASSPESTTTPR